MSNIYNLTDTWNAAGVTFTAIKMNVTDTASAAGSRLIDLQVAGSSRLYLDKSGALFVSGPITASSLSLSSALALSSGGTGATTAAGARASILPALATNGGKVLAVNAGATDVEWITLTGGGSVSSVNAAGGSTGLTFSGGPITGSGTLTLGGVLALASGGTGAITATAARVNLLPSYSSNAGKVLTVNSGGTDVEWVASNSVNRKYTAIASGTTGQWFPIFNMSETTNGPVTVNVKTYAHSSVTFIAYDGYGPSGLNHIVVLGAMYNPNSGYANISGVRILDNGQVEVQFTWSTGPVVDIDVSVYSAGSTVPALYAALNANAGAVTVHDTVDITGLNGRIRTENGFTASAGDVRAPLFRDISNAAYYLQPANTGTSLVTAGGVLVGTTTAGSPGFAQANSLNISFVESTGGQSLGTIFRQANSADLVIGSGVRRSSTADGFASSFSSPWARSAINVGYGGIKFFTAAEATVAVGTDTTMTERLRIGSAGQIGLSGANYGATGQVLTSQGGSAAPIWTTPATGVASFNTRTGAVTLSSADVTSALAYTPATRSTNAFPNSPNASLGSLDLRTMSNPTTGLGYAGGGRFRFSSLNDDNLTPYADVIDLSTYTDASGGGFNSLYFGKNSQLIQHKYAAAAATSWTVKTIAYTDSNITGTASNITGVYGGTITSSQVTTGLGFTPYNATNPAGYITNTGNARIGVENNGTLVGTRRNINFIPGTGISYTIADDSANEEVDVTITNTGVTSVGMTVPTGLSVSPASITTTGTFAVTLTTGYSIPTTASQTNWDTAHTDRLKWDGGSTGLVAATGRTSLGATTVGSNLFTLANPTAVTFLRVNADNTVSALDAATFRTAIGAGTGSGSGTVTSVSVVSANGFAGTVATNSTTPAITISTSISGLLKGNGTAMSAAVAGTDYVIPSGSITGNASTATTLQTARLINGVSFNGSANITITDGSTRFQSVSDFVDGTLVTTDIPANVVNGSSFIIEITGKSYSSTVPPFKVIAQGYLYNDTIISFSGINYGGAFSSYIKTFEDGGVLKFWWPRISYWNSFNVNVMSMDSATNGNTTRNRVTAIANSLEPTGTKKVQINLATTWNSTNFTPSTYLPLVGGTMTGAITFAAGQTWPTFNQSTTGSAATLTTARTLTIGSTGKTFNGSADVAWSLAEIGAAATSHTHTIAGITDAARWWNNFGDTHGTRSSFDTGTMSIGYGWRYVQGSTNGPGVNGATQYYSVYTGLGNDYPATGASSYGMQIAFPRNVTTPYITIRYNENNVVGAWQKISAGYADTAGSAASLTGTYGGTLTSSQVTTALGFTPYNATNPSGYTSNAGTVTSVSVASANGFGGTVATNSTTPAITISTSISGLLKGNGTAISAATAGTDYVIPSGSITGSAGSLSANSNYMVDRGTVTQANVDTATLNGFYLQSNPSDSQGILVFNPGGSLGPLQMTFTYGGLLQFRNKTDSATWTAWKTALTSANFSSYAPTLTGGGASGTWGINVTGNAATVTNGVYTTGDQFSISGTKRFLSPSNTIINTVASGDRGLAIFQDTTSADAYMTFHISNDYAAYFGLGGAENDLVYGGWSAGANRHRILHSGNYTSWAPSLTGGGASGTWAISVTGNAATATSADQIDGVGFRNTGSNASTNADTIESNGITYYGGGVPNFTGNATDGALYSQAYSANWQHQIAGDYRSGQIALRGKNNGTWQSWRTVIDSGNYNSYAPTLTGGGASGTWGINVTGNAATVGSLSVHAGTNNEANKIVRTDANGYIIAGYINSANGNEANNSNPPRVWGTNGSDSYLRTYLTSALSVGYAASAGSAGSASTLSALGNYVWSQSTLPTTYPMGIQSSFVGPAAGEGSWQAYGSVMTMRTYAGGGGSLQLYVPYGPSNGGIGLQARFGNYDVSSGNAWTSWKTLLASDNFSSYALPLSGGTLTGTLTGTIGNFATRVYSGYDSGQTGAISCNNWFRSSGDTGWFSATHSGGIYMTDATWVRTYNSKAFYVNNEIAASGNITAYYSDERLKIKTGRLENAIDKVKSLNGFTYVENDLARELGYKNKKQQVGVSAQEVQAVLPEAVSLAPVDYETLEDGTIVSKTGENYLTVDYSRLVPLLIEAVKEQQAQIDELKNMLNKALGE